LARFLLTREPGLFAFKGEAEMAREMVGDEQEMFRAVVATTTIYTDGRPSHTSVHHYGPYGSKGTANAQITHKRREAYTWNLHHAVRAGYALAVEGHAEKAHIVWVKVSS
jgi:hypothetical protein